MTSDANAETDLLIIGAGIAGCISAIAFADRYKVTLIDQLPKPLDRIGESLAPAAMRILRELCLYKGLNPVEGSPLFIQNIGMQSYWGSDRVQILDHLGNPDGYGLNLNRQAFESYLRKTALERGVRCIWPATYYSSSYENSRWQVIAKADNDGLIEKLHRFTARMVVDATGRQSRFARSLGIKREHFDKLISCWATLPDNEENRMSTISACESGWWYSAVVPGNKRVLAFQTDSDLVDRSVLANVQSFLSLARENNQIKEILERSLGTIKFHGTVSANSTRLTQMTGKQWFALGDAAISFDPLSSQGMFHAMASAMQFKELTTDLDFIPYLDAQKMEELQLLYASQMDAIWNRYIHHKAIYYGAEMRWKASPFWQRRHENLSP